MSYRHFQKGKHSGYMWLQIVQSGALFLGLPEK